MQAEGNIWFSVQVNEALGLLARPSKPLLWKLGGHPRLPPSQHLYSLACSLQQLCMAASLSSNQGADALKPVKQLLVSAARAVAAAQHRDGGAGSETSNGGEGSEREISDELASTVAADLAADVELRRSLQEGVALFQLAVSWAAGQPGTGLMLGRLGANAAEPAAAAASIVDTLQREMEARALQVNAALSAMYMSAVMSCSQSFFDRQLRAYAHPYIMP